MSIGDRDAALDADDREGYSMGPFRLLQMQEESFKVSSGSRTYRADERFKGAWSCQAAGRSSFAYRLQSWGGSLISYPCLRYGNNSPGGGVLGALVGGGSVLFHSKDFSFEDKARAYNHYTLKRTDMARNPIAYRNWDSSDENGVQSTSRNHLVESTSGFDQYWYSFVYDEKYADSSADKLDESRQSGDALPGQPSGRKEYKRFDTFVTLSQ